jgi:lipoate-protein ligase A
MPDMWRLVDSDLVPPSESVALDEAILAAHIEGLVPNTLHFYRRSRPTISVGYFQRISESLDLEECRRRDVAIVRRKSGGSSIYTDQGQIIYGLVVHDRDVPRDRAESFRMICSALASALSSFGVDARYRPMNDVEVCGRKVSGNAQLRRKGSVLQHGTIIVDADPGAMDAVLRVDQEKSHDLVRPSKRVDSMSNLIGKPLSMEIVKAKIVEQMEKAFGVVIKRGALTQWELAHAARLVEQRYSNPDWNLKF